MTTKSIMANRISNYEWNIKVEVNGERLSTVMEVPFQTRFLEIEIPRLAQNEVNLNVILIQSVAGFGNMGRTHNGEWCIRSDFSRLESTFLDWSCIDETQNSHCCGGFADVVRHQSIRNDDGFKA